MDPRGPHHAGGTPSNQGLYEPQLPHSISNEQVVGPSTLGSATPGYPNNPQTTQQQHLQGQQAPEKLIRKEKKKEKDKQFKASKKLKFTHTAHQSQPNTYSNGPQMDTTNYGNQRNVYQQTGPHL